MKPSLPENLTETEEQRRYVLAQARLCHPQRGYIRGADLPTLVEHAPQLGEAFSTLVLCNHVLQSAGTHAPELRCRASFPCKAHPASPLILAHEPWFPTWICDALREATNKYGGEKSAERLRWLRTVLAQLPMEQAPARGRVAEYVRDHGLPVPLPAEYQLTAAVAQD